MFSNIVDKFSLYILLVCNSDQQKKARKALQWLRGLDADVSQEFGEIEKANQLNKGQEPPTFTTIFNRMYVRPLLISLGLMFFQQMSGINAYMFYNVKIFQVCFITVSTLLSNGIGILNLFENLMKYFCDYLLNTLPFQILGLQK